MIIRNTGPFSVRKSEQNMTFSKADEAKNLAEGSMAGVLLGGKDILVVNTGGTLFAIGNICTHRGCRLSTGTLSGDRVKCRCHGSVFNVKTGEVVNGPAKIPEPVFKIKTENGDVIVDI
jgi:3-phenylpropionate/trans-cinnamate dioxygenase ferredoxin subunit/anthranilate 1,2-dioxygenase ferredoxin subunit